MPNSTASTWDGKHPVQAAPQESRTMSCQAATRITALLLPKHIKPEPFASSLPLHGLTASENTLPMYTVRVEVLAQALVYLQGLHQVQAAAGGVQQLLRKH